MTERIVRPGEFYRHFKNKLYQIVAVARHSETGEPMVVYQALYGDYGVYVRPYAMFTSEVDHEKYPEVTQKWRFERVEPGQSVAGAGQAARQEAAEKQGTGYQTNSVSGQESGMHNDVECRSADVAAEPEIPDRHAERKPYQYYADRTPDPAFLQFLDTENFELRMECLKVLEDRITQQELDSMYLVLDMKPERGSLQEQLYAVRRFLAMQKRYDGSRLR